MEFEQSPKTIKAPWNPVDGFEILRKRFGDVIIFTVFAENNISADNALTLLLNVILKTGVFKIWYKEWHNLPDTKRTLVNVLEW